VLSCYDRMVITETLPGMCYVDAHDSPHLSYWPENVCEERLIL
jgi:hypothetical protein